MADRPILFSGPMVRAIAEGSKTQTRRVLLPAPFIDSMGNFCAPDREGRVSCYGQRTDGTPVTDFYQKMRVPFAVGDRLWVRETWRCNGWARDVATIFYRASEGDGYTAMCNQFPVEGKKHTPVTATWKPGIHMPRWASRWTLTVSEVRVQRLQDISEADAYAEGVVGRSEPGLFTWHAGDDMSFVGAVDAYRLLWDRLNEARGFGWKANPWVVAVTFAAEQRNIDA